MEEVVVGGTLSGTRVLCFSHGLKIVFADTKSLLEQGMSQCERLWRHGGLSGCLPGFMEQLPCGLVKLAGDWDAGELL
jgi:hypothetical protein